MVQELLFFYGVSVYFGPDKAKPSVRRGRKKEKLNMVAYEFYWRDETGKEHLIGILPERRKNPERITEKSILNWGWKVIGDHSDVNKIYFVQVEM